MHGLKNLNPLVRDKARTNEKLVGPQINTTEETFQSHIIDSTIFQTNSFDVLSEFALLVSCTTCSAYSADNV